MLHLLQNRSTELSAGGRGGRRELETEADSTTKSIRESLCCVLPCFFVFVCLLCVDDFHRTRPSLLEYLSYLLNFMSIIAGPCSNYKDYIAFIEGRHVHMKLLEVNWKQKGYDRLPDPSPTVSFKMTKIYGKGQESTALYMILIIKN